MSEAKGARSPAAAPVLAQIRKDAPGRAFWFGIGTLIWVVWFGGLEAVARWLRPPRSLPSPDEALAFGGGVAAILAVILLHPLLQVAMMRRLGAPARLEHRGVRWLPVAGRPLSRRAALFVLLLPQFTLFLLGLAAVARGWSWGPFFAATAMAVYTPERALAARVHRERGCTEVDFRPDGAVLYGTGRAFRPPAAAILWLGALLMSAGWMLVALVSGRELTEAVANAVLELRSRHEITPYRYQSSWRTLKSRHQIWIDGPRARVEVTPVPPVRRLPAPSSQLPAPGARRSVETPGAGSWELGAALPPGAAFPLDTISDGHALICGPEGTFLLQRGSRQVVRLKAGPLEASAVPSVPAVDPAALAGWRPGRVGAARIGRYRVQVYERDGRLGGQRFSTRLWVTPGLPVPVRIEETLPHEEREETLRSLRINPPLPDRLFRLPGG